MSRSARALPVAAGAGDYTHVIPELFAAEFNPELYARTVFGEICNTKYEGRFKAMGDKIQIPTMPASTNRAHVEGADLVYDTLSPGNVEMVIARGIDNCWHIPTTALRQSNVKTLAEDFAKHAAKTVAGGTNGIDQTVLANIYSSVHAKNKGLTAGIKSSDINLGVAGTPLAWTRTNAMEIIIERLAVVLAEQNIAEDEPLFLVVPPWAAARVKNSEYKDSAMSGGQLLPAVNGRLGKVAGFTVFQSNNLDTSSSGGQTAYECIFGHKMATTFAAQMTIKESLKHPTKYGDVMRTLTIYDFKVTMDKALGHLHIYKG